MGLLDVIRGKRHQHAGPDVPYGHVQGEIFTPGAMGFSYVPLTDSTPRFDPLVNPWHRFTPLRVYQPPMTFQFLAVPNNPPQGYPYIGIQPPASLIDPSMYPSIMGDYYS